MSLWVAADAFAQAAPANGYPPAGNRQAPYPQQQQQYQPQPAPYPQQQQQFPQQQQQYQPQPAPYPQQQQQYPQGAYGAQPGYAQPGPGYAPPPMVAAPEGPMVSSVDSVLQIGLSTAFLQHLSTSLKPDMGDKVSQSSTNWGFVKNPVTLEAGYGLTANWLIGGLLQLGGQSDSAKAATAPAAKSSSFGLLLGPKVDYMFMPDSKLNPFASVVLAVGVGSNSIDPLKQSSTTFNFQARAGVRYFLFDSLSIDPTFFIGGAIGSTTQTLNALVNNYSVSSFQVGLSVGLSLWLK